MIKGQHPGAKWRKSDLQCHSPRDLGWEGSGLPGGTDLNEKARKDWAEKFVGAMLNAKLGVAAITDHHDVCMAKYVQKNIADNDLPLLVYSGIEFTLSDAAQCLAIFDPNTSEDEQRALIAKAGNVVHAHPDDSKTCPIQPTNANVSKLFEEVENEAYLRESCILLPHFSTEDAHKSLNQPGHHPRFATLECDGVYIERPYETLDEVTKNKIQGRIKDWGTRRRAIVPTGDNRTPSWERLGKHDCWIKLGENTIEGLRQALLADEARITYERPEEPRERIRSMTVQASLTGATPLKITFNAGFNAFIGGRGSGKSALLEYLRFGLGRTETDVQLESASVNQREAKLIEDTLVGGFVEVELQREGVNETWRREYATRAQITVQGASGELILDPKSARERFRARGFSQKGLSTTTRDLATASEQITSIAAAEDVDRRRIVEQEIKNAQRDITTSLNQLAAYWQSRLESRRAQDRVTDLSARLESLSVQMTAEGVSEDDLATIDQQPKYLRGANYLLQVQREVESGQARVNALIGKLLDVELGSFKEVQEFDELAHLHHEVRAVKSRVALHLEAAKAELVALGRNYSNKWVEFGARRSAHAIAYDAATARQSANKALLADNKRLTEELATAETAAGAAAASERERSPAVAGFASARKRLTELVEERWAVLKNAAESVEIRSSNLLTARPKRESKPKAYQWALCALLEATHVHNVEHECEKWLETSLAEGSGAWSELIDTIIALYEAKISAGSPTDPGDEIGQQMERFFFGGRTLTPNQKRRIYANLGDTTVGTLVSAVSEDFILLKYVDEGLEIPFERASPGQQASALLELLLKQSAGTLIIDQPEDDLDNRVIMSIVHLIRTSKSSRQLIFTTHNPNIVVNGDADKIIALRSADPDTPALTPSARIRIDTDGAIETDSVRSAITKIMEGGSAAFDLRRRKYRFEYLAE